MPKFQFNFVRRESKRIIRYRFPLASCVLIFSLITTFFLPSFPPSRDIINDVLRFDSSSSIPDAVAAPLQQTSCAEKLILFVGADPLPPQDAQIVEYLTSKGYGVESTSLSGFNSAQAEAFDLVMVSRSVTASEVGTTFTSLETPLLTWEGYIYGDLQMTGIVQNTDFGRVLEGSSVTIVDAAHPIAAGNSGSVATHSSTQVFHWGVPSENAAVIAAIENAPAQAAIFAYEKGATMVNLEAPSRRVAMHDVTINQHTAEGNQIFYAATAWAIDCTAAPPTNGFLLNIEIEGEGTVDYDPKKDSYRPGDIVALEAIPDSGWAFSGWKGNVLTILNPTLVVFGAADKDVKATFIRLPGETVTPTVTLTTTVTATPIMTTTPTAVITPTVTPTEVFTITPDITSTPVLTMTPADTPTATPTFMPTATPTPEVSAEPPIGSGGGKITHERWYGIEDAFSINSLMNLESYPDNPDVEDEQDEFRLPGAGGEFYGSRLHGYVHPPTTGIYTFYIAGDDRGALFLSTDDQPNNERQIAEVPAWTLEDEWDKYPEQQSLIVFLEAGKRYYIKALHVQGTAGEHLSVAWESLAFSRQVVDGQYLSPFIDTIPTKTPPPPTVIITGTPGTTPETTPTMTPEPATPTALPAEPDLSLKLRDSLATDQDDDGRAELGDTVLYQVELNNSGTAPAQSIVFQLIPDKKSHLKTGTVETSQGSVEKGNQPSDTQVLIDIGDVAAQSTVVLTFEVEVSDVSADQSLELRAQGTIVGLNIDQLQTDDPDTTEVNDATITTLHLERSIYVSKKDLLFIDNDEDERFSAGDRVIYIIRILNQGQLPLTDIRLVDIPDEDTTLVNGEVIASAGSVVLGNSNGETSVEVNVAEIAPGDDVFVRIQVQINGQISDTQIFNQAIVTLAESVSVTGQNRIQSDDPDTESMGDPTITTVFSAGEFFKDELYLPMLIQ